MSASVYRGLTLQSGAWSQIQDTNYLGVGLGIDASSSIGLVIGGINATSITLGPPGTPSSITVTVTGNLTVNGIETVIGTSEFENNVLYDLDVHFKKEVDHVVSVNSSTTVATNGGALSITSGTGNTSGNGGALTLDAGAAGGTGIGGALQIGNANAASIGIGRSGITTTITGTFTASGSANLGTSSSNDLVINSRVNSDLQFKQGATRTISIQQNASGSGDVLAIYSGAAGAGKKNSQLVIDVGNPNSGGVGELDIGKTFATALSVGNSGASLEIDGSTFTGIFATSYDFQTGTGTSRLQIIDSGGFITVQAGTTLNCTSTGMIDLPQSFKIGTVATHYSTPNTGQVTAANLDTLTAGSASNADSLHTHSAATVTQLLITGLTTTGVTSTGYACYLSGASTVSYADCTSMVKATFIGVYNGTAGQLVSGGLISMVFTGTQASVGKPVYLSTVAGQISKDPPAAGNAYVQAEVGISVDGANLILLQPKAPIQLV